MRVAVHGRLPAFGAGGGVGVGGGGLWTTLHGLYRDNRIFPDARRDARFRGVCLMIAAFYCSSPLLAPALGNEFTSRSVGLCSVAAGLSCRWLGYCALVDHHPDRISFLRNMSLTAPSMLPRCARLVFAITLHNISGKALAVGVAFGAAASGAPRSQHRRGHARPDVRLWAAKTSPSGGVGRIRLPLHREGFIPKIAPSYPLGSFPASSRPYILNKPLFSGGAGRGRWGIAENPILPLCSGFGRRGHALFCGRRRSDSRVPTLRPPAHAASLGVIIGFSW